MSLVNYLGTYETLDQVWEAYPEGGKEGDYLYIASVLKKWNKYTSAWADPTEEDVDGSTIMSLEEDVVVGSSTLINYLGRFETLGDTLNAYPEGGNEGDYIYVGDDIYAWDKYANEWVVSLDAPLEVAISEEDIIPNSNTFINYLGGFVDRDAVWQKYPEGGKVGDYLYIASDLHIWDKYICNWVAATPPDESSQIRPIEHLTQEGVVEYSENYINYLGVFESIEQAWEVYPEGGKEGDYIIVGGEQLRWNKYTANWGEYDPDASTPARPVATIYGDLHVHNDVIIGEDLYARILETFTTKKWVLEQGYISLDDVTSELVMSKIVPDNTTIEVRDGKLVVIGGGGGTADSVAWSNITGKPSWIGSTKPSYSYDEITGAPDLSIYALSATTLAGYGITDTYTKTHIDNTFVKLAAAQSIQARHDFTDGLEVGGMPIYKSKDDTVYLDCNLVVRGGITAFGTNETITASLFEALPIDGKTVKRNPETNELYVDTSVIGGGGLDEDALEKYLDKYNYATTSDISSALNGYATESWVLSQKYLTGISWSEITSRPTALSQFTDDVVSGKYLPITGGTVTGQIILDAKGWYPSFAYMNNGGRYGEIGFSSKGVAAIYDETAWRTIIHSGNIGEQSVASLIQEPVTDLNDVKAGTFFQSSYHASNLPSGAYRCLTGIALATDNNPMYKVMLGIDYSGNLFSRAENGGKWLDWEQIAFTNSDITGNAGSATKLQTPRTIWGLSFDGTGNIWGNLTNVGNIYSRGAQNGGYVIYSSIRWDEALSIEVTDAKGNWLSNGITVKTNGNVAIGGTTADAKLHIYGNVIAQNAYGGAEFVFDNNIGQNRAIFVLDPNPNNGVGMGLDYLTLEQRADGVATLSSPYLSLTLGNDKVLTVDGNFLAKGGITAQNSSDRRLKRNIRKFNASKVLMSLGGVWEYEYIDSEVEKNHIYEGTHYGLIYQNIKGTTLDVMCHEREDGFGTLNYYHQKFISLIAGATMENISEVEKLKRKIRHLEAKVKQLERREA